MAYSRRPRVCFTLVPPIRLRCRASAANSPLPSDSNVRGNTLSTPPPRSARLGIIRVRELEVRAAARSAALRIALANQQLQTLAHKPDTAAEDGHNVAEIAAALLAALERETRALRKLDDQRLDDDIADLVQLCDRVRIASETVAAAKVSELESKPPTAETPTAAKDGPIVTKESEEVAGKIARGVRRGGVELVRRAESVRSGAASRMAEFVRDDGSIDFKGLRVLLSGVVDSAGNVWLRLSGQVPPDVENGDARFAPVNDDEEQFRLREEISILERELQAASKAREGVLRREDQLGKLIRAKEIRAMDDSVSAVRRTLAVRVLQLEMEKIFVSLAEEIMRSDDEQSLLIAEFGELDARLCEMCVFIDNEEPLLVGDDTLGEVASDIQYLKTRLGLDATLYTSTTLDWMQVKQMFAGSLKKTRAGLEFYARGFRLFVGDLAYAARLVRRAVGGYTPTPREVRTLQRTGRDLVTLVPFTIILVLPLTPVGHVLVFSFLQRNWPEFFPSTFSERRQALMKRYENYAREMGNSNSIAADAAFATGDRDDVRDNSSSNSDGSNSGRKGVLKRVLFFWRWFDNTNASNSTQGIKQTSDAAAAVVASSSSGDDSTEQLRLEAPSKTTVPMRVTSSNGLAPDVDSSSSDDANVNSRVRSSKVNSRMKTMGIDDLHLAD